MPATASLAQNSLFRGCFLIFKSIRLHKIILILLCISDFLVLSFCLYLMLFE